MNSRQIPQSTVVIIANGELGNGDQLWLGEIFAREPVVIAADGGGRYLSELGLNAKLIIGDMDSLSLAQQAQLSANGSSLERHPRDKDKIDLELALQYCAVHFPTARIYILAATGGRLDMTLANVQLLLQPSFQDLEIIIATENEELSLLRGRSQIAGRVGQVLSFLPCDNDVMVASSSGLQWNMANEVLPMASTRGISNVLIADTAEIELSSGAVYCVLQRARF